MDTVKDSDIVPESYQMRLMMWRDEFTRGYFEIGDIANDIVLVNVQKGMQVEHAQIYSAVGRFCGKSGRTIRDYAEISAFYPKEIREQYDMLPFSHFRFAKTMGRKWEDALDYSMLHPDASEDKLIKEFNVARGGVVATNGGLDPESVEKYYVAASSGSDVAPSVAADLSGIYVLANLVSQAETMLSWEMKKDTRRKLLLALDALKDVLRELCDKEETLQFDYQKEDYKTRENSV